MKYTAAMLASALLTPLALAQPLIRPNGATATSEFSSLYVIANAINGSGLPANFTVSDAHANYAVNNHWTTRAGETIGQSATFTFTQPQTLAGFHMWAHRSNNIAANPHYAVTRFDLVFRDGSGNIISTLTNLTGQPNVATAQTTSFDVISGVRSVQFIVRATANNNSSPYTGLAEVAFGPCIPPIATLSPDALTCPGGDVTLTVQFGGSGLRTFAWEALDADNNVIPLVDGPIPGFSAVLSGTAAQTLVISGVDAATAAALRFRCVISNPCGSQASEPASITLCNLDFNCDNFVDFFDFDDFVTAFENGDMRADINGDLFLDFFDYDDFVFGFEAGC